MKKIIIDITSLNDCQNEVTGIPRVVAEYSKRIALRFNNCIFVYYNYIDKNFHLVNLNKFIKYLNDLNKNKKFFTTNRVFKINSKISNSVFFDIGPVESSYKRSELYMELKRLNCKIISILYDVTPFDLNVFEQTEASIFNFINAFSSMFLFSDHIIAISNSEKENILKYAKLFDCSSKIQTIPLGSNFNSAFNINNVSNVIKKLCNENYLLSVGTLAPRKNHKLIINSYINALSKQSTLNLIIAGHIGWKCNETIEIMKSSKLWNKRLFFIDSPNNDEIIYLYKHAFATIMASLTEGFGLPVVESLFYKCPVFCSDIHVFHEISNEKAIFFDNKDIYDLANKILIYYNSSKKYNFLKKSLSDFKFISWDESYLNIEKILKIYEK